MKLLKTMAIASVLLLLLAACSEDTNGTSSGSDDRVVTSDRNEYIPPTTPSCVAGEEPDTTGTCQPCTSYERCYDSPDDMKHFYDVIIGWINEYSRATYRNMPAPSNWYIIPPNSSVQSPCGENRPSNEAYEYCPLDKSVYIGADMMWQFYSENGDAAPAVGITHEWGHHVQQSVGVLPQNRTNAQTIRSENQADCIAGSWVAYMDQRGIMEATDITDIEGLIRFIASSESDPNRDHGTIQERAASFNIGLTSGIRACNTIGLGSVIN